MASPCALGIELLESDKKNDWYLGGKWSYLIKWAMEWKVHEHYLSEKGRAIGNWRFFEGKLKAIKLGHKVEELLSWGTEIEVDVDIHKNQKGGGDGSSSGVGGLR